MRTVLTIAGSDCSGGAGIQADIKTIMAHGLYAMSAITALTAQNTTGVYGIDETTPEFLRMQLDAIFTDIRPDAVKIGMVGNIGLIQTIVGTLQEYHASNIVLDPVMVSTSGSSLLREEAARELVHTLFPLASVITPNIPEAERLSGITITSQEDRERAAQVIGDSIPGAVLVKGGHGIHTADDLLYENGTFTWFRGERIENPNTHGTGCTLSSAIACNLAQDYSVATSVANAKTYIKGALQAGLDLGAGNGPLNHGYAIRIKEK